MTWGQNHRVNVLSQLHKASRYYHRLHHTILSIFIAGYIALIILQMSILADGLTITNDLNKELILVIAIGFILFIVIPSLLTWLIVHYHIKQGKIRENIRTLQTDLNFPEQYKDDKGYEGFKDKCCIEQFCTGFGHIIFVVLLWLVVLINILVSCVIYN